ncbi:MAG: single-stranded DNA-binding protein [Verrucomicrobia bacterium]|jgi:single-strand DNA-binding protein|nr:single-stranded DNA-binding protein [Verrucomicrobiota bacterium]MDA0905462.1 single-stranded DNA-binding protein [Verrucomicrobiota bacterium]MDA1078148.1 single-stranded DNA-binding protein [Verrucomicrobiota bacterium]NDH16383.1 single-stranded DNA-binding protein [Opitutae bacterium]
MASLNKVLLIGNLTRDPEVRMMSSGRPVCNFGLALNRNYKDAEGNKKEEVTFVDVECFGPRAEAVGRFFSKGRAIFVEGRLKLDQWETKEGEKRSAIRVVLDNFEFVDAGKSDGHTTSDQSNRPVTPTEKPKPQESLSDDNGFDEDVPF